jgi:hypothetical protein
MKYNQSEKEEKELNAAYGITENKLPVGRFVISFKNNYVISYSISLLFVSLTSYYQYGTVPYMYAFVEVLIMS